MDLTLPLLFFFFVIIPSSILHEYAHGWVADKLGDPTPRLSGRLTINPVPHIDPVGTLLLPVGLFLLTHGSFMFAYAKPVPFNPLALRWQRFGSAAVALAGPLTNLIVAFVCGGLLQIAPLSNWTLILAVVTYANVMLAVFNLVPIPPLDGSKILYALLPDRYYAAKVWLERYGYFILIFFIFFLFSAILSPVIHWIFGLAAGRVGELVLFQGLGA
jgi:Zn-dependent protease